MRGWKTRHRARVGFGDQSAMPDRQMAIRRCPARCFVAMQFALGVDPCKARLARRRQRQTRVIEDRPTIFLRVHDRLDVHQGLRRDRP